MDAWKDKVAVVTGASRGIGAETARLFAERGAKVVLTARSADAITALAEAIRGDGGEAVAVAGDVTRYADVEAVVATATERFGRLDVLVNNAGAIEPIARLADSDPAAWDTAFDVNAKGVYHGLRAAIPAMRAGGGGVVVNVSSGAAVNALEGWSHYCAGKAAALMLTRAAHLEYGGAGIRVVGLSPGTVATDMQVAIKASGINRVSELDWSDHIPPDWAARAIAWLVTDDARAFDGGDVSLRDEDIRRRVGLVG
jgi:NAD(P)-dependent dehydrogenase (short-subunit alcohol dehydrogenase family)